MTKVFYDLLFEGMPDELDDEVVFRQPPKGKIVKGEVVITKAPGKTPVGPSKAQEEHRRRFREAIAYAKRAMEDPQMHARYERETRERKGSPFNMAVSAYLKRSKKSGKQDIPPSERK